MICIISPSERIAINWANNQSLAHSEYFYGDEYSIRTHHNFHTIVIGMFPEERLGWFEKIYHLAKVRGSIGNP